MIEEDVKWLDDHIEDAKQCGYDRVVELLEYIKKEMTDKEYNMSDNTRQLLWELAEYITIY